MMFWLKIPSFVAMNTTQDILMSHPRHPTNKAGKCPEVFLTTSSGVIHETLSRTVVSGLAAFLSETPPPSTSTSCYGIQIITHLEKVNMKRSLRHLQMCYIWMIYRNVTCQHLILKTGVKNNGFGKKNKRNYPFLAMPTNWKSFHYWNVHDKFDDILNSVGNRKRTLDQQLPSNREWRIEVLSPLRLETRIKTEEKIGTIKKCLFHESNSFPPVF